MSDRLDRVASPEDAGVALPTSPPDDAGVALPTSPPDDDEPSVLGAAATLPAERRSRRTRRSRVPRSYGRRGGRPAPAADGQVVPLDGYSDTVYVFEAATRPDPPLLPYVRSLWERRRFMMELARAEIRGTRTSTVFGGLWAILDPLLQAAIYFMLFTILRKGDRPIDFLHVLIGGLFLFQLALAAITEGGRSIRKSRDLMLNSTFPRALFPMTTICKGVLTLGPTVLVYAAFHIGLQAPVGPGLLLLPVLFVLQIVLMVGLALLVSTLVVFFNDAANAVQYVARLLFFTTPVIFPLALIPEGLRLVLSFQPLFALFSCYQEVLDGGVPSLGLLLQVVLWAGGIIVIGTRVFLRHEHEFGLRL